MTSKRSMLSDAGIFSIKVVDYSPSHGVYYPKYTVSRTYNRIDGIGWQIKIESVKELRELHAALGKLITEAEKKDPTHKLNLKRNIPEKEHIVDRFNDLDV